MLGKSVDYSRKMHKLLHLNLKIDCQIDLSNQNPEFDFTTQKLESHMELFRFFKSW